MNLNATVLSVCLRQKVDLNDQKDALSGFTFGADTTVILEKAVMKQQ